MRELTYGKRRGYHHTACQVCGATRRERIPDQVAQEYQHNPGNPILGVCPGCNHGRGMGGLEAALLAWNRAYETVRPHQALGYKTPDEFYHDWLGTRFSRKEVLSDMS